MLSSQTFFSMVAYTSCMLFAESSTPWEFHFPETYTSLKVPPPRELFWGCLYTSGEELPGEGNSQGRETPRGGELPGEGNSQGRGTPRGGELPGEGNSQGRGTPRGEELPGEGNSQGRGIPSKGGFSVRGELLGGVDS